MLLHAREKVGKSTLLRAAVAAATNGNPFLEQPTIGGRVLWVGEEAVGDVKGQLVEAGANLDRLFFIRELNPSRKHEASLPKLVALLRPVWVIIDTWKHYLHVNRVTDTAGPGEQGLLLGDVANLAQQYDVAITVSHQNMKNRPEYRDSTVLGAIADMIAPFDRGDAPLVRRLRPSGRWHLAPVDIRWTRGVGYEVVDDAEGAEPSGRRSSAESVPDRLLLHLLDLDPDARPSARVLASALSCQGRRYNELKAAVERLVGEGSIDHARRPGSASSRDGGFALTPEGRLRAEALRENFNSGLATNEREHNSARGAQPFPSLQPRGWPETGTQPRPPRSRIEQVEPASPCSRVEEVEERVLVCLLQRPGQTATTVLVPAPEAPCSRRRSFQAGANYYRLKLSDIKGRKGRRDVYGATAPGKDRNRAGPPGRVCPLHRVRPGQGALPIRRDLCRRQEPACPHAPTETDRCEDTRRQVVGRQTKVRPLTPSIPAGLPIRFGRSWKAARRWPADWTNSRLPAVSRLRWSACRAALRRRRSGFAPVAPPAQSRRRAVLRPSGGPLALRSRRDLRHRARLVRRSGRPGHRCRARRDRRCSIIVAAWSDDAALLEALFWDRSWIVGRRLERLAGRQSAVHRPHRGRMPRVAVAVSGESPEAPAVHGRAFHLPARVARQPRALRTSTPDCVTASFRRRPRRLL